MITRTQRPTRDIATRDVSTRRKLPTISLRPTARERAGGYSVIRPQHDDVIDLAVAEASQDVIVAERDRQLMADAFDALLTRERQAAIAWAQNSLKVAGTRFAGSMDDLRKLHAYRPMPRVAQLIERERQISETRMRLGGI